MSQNDTLLVAQGTDVYSGVRNPTSNPSDPLSENFVTDPTASKAGAGADPRIDYGETARRGMRVGQGVVEQRPGIIESTNIDPLNENSNKDDGWANVPPAGGKTTTSSLAQQAASYLPTTGQVQEFAQNAVNAAAGAGKFAYGHVTGDDQLKTEGRKEVKDNTGY
ncbi:hypothetical protein DACRYDRAFT_58213 [Dacryopinax primogenitus]|uniref:Uncharacterized protein n=1 Tax=Dacryopinax primogenitus (strain DJM 731) TaxID=1858805 RepID=M5FNQ8_DACPD|nr:uncharacterized protein DACRYDRAFT_58213 [Dacryopinax primogenitus]EJT97815.1 hypothetical protein DACRYDRAFT_58213 [Dacryopinax primogenitus]